MTGQDRLTLRPGRDADGVGMAALIARVFGEYEGCAFEPAEFPELAAPASHYAAKGGALWVVEDDGEVVASTALFLNGAAHRHICELGKVYVAAELRGSGLAQRLLDTAMAKARAFGARELVLFSDTRFTRAHRFYERLGFTRLPGVRLIHDESDTIEFGYRMPLGAARAA